MRYCCPNCFADSWLQEEIRAKSTITGRCSFCKSDGIALLAPFKLEDAFQNAMQFYSPVIYGETLRLDEDILEVGQWPSVLLQEDFEIFADCLNVDDSAALVGETFLTTHISWLPTSTRVAVLHGMTRLWRTNGRSSVLKLDGTPTLSGSTSLSTDGSHTSPSPCQWERYFFEHVEVSRS